MNKAVTVLANEAGQVINVSENNPEFGYIKVSQNKIVFENGWAKKKSLSAIIPGTIEELTEMEAFDQQSLPGKIYVVESLTPFNKENPEKDQKMAGKTDIPCTLDGQAIYRKTYYTDDLSVVDVKIAHNNSEAIKTAYAAQKAKATKMQPSADFN